MLIGKMPKKPSIENVRAIKRAIRAKLNLNDEAIITVSQLACLEQDCSPLETVIGLLRPGSPQLQHKFHKSVNDVNVEDLAILCAQWGVQADPSTFEQFFITNQP